MHYLTLSFTHKNTDIELREKLSFADEEKLLKFYNDVLEPISINEMVVLSTCNRVEIMTSVMDFNHALEHIYEALSHHSKSSKKELVERGYVYEDQGAIHHLFSVASSLDSLVIGETQIVGQLKDAYIYAYEKGFCSQKLSRAIHKAFKCASEVRNQTQISKNPVSVSSVAVAKAKEIFDNNLAGYTALVIGAGEMSTLTAKHLNSSGVNIIILNRNRQKADELAKELGGTARSEPYEELEEYINNYRLLFSATGATEPIITKDMIQRTNFKRYWFDIAVPRDIEDIEDEDIEIFAVDDLKKISEQNRDLREEQAALAYRIVADSTVEFFKWLSSLSVDPIIKEMRKIAKECSLKEIDRAIKKGYLPKEQKEQVEKILHSAFNNFLHKPTKQLKSIAQNPEGDMIIQSVQYFFQC